LKKLFTLGWSNKISIIEALIYVSAVVPSIDAQFTLWGHLSIRKIVLIFIANIIPCDYSGDLGCVPFSSVIFMINHLERRLKAHMEIRKMET
jgi:hypothetical protein